MHEEKSRLCVVLFHASGSCVCGRSWVSVRVRADPSYLAHTSGTTGSWTKRWLTCSGRGYNSHLQGLVLCCVGGTHHTRRPVETLLRVFTLRVRRAAGKVRNLPQALRAHARKFVSKVKKKEKGYCAVCACGVITSLFVSFSSIGELCAAAHRCVRVRTDLC